MAKSNNFAAAGLAVFLISPLLAYVVALKNLRFSWSKNIIWFFCGFVGYTLQIPPNSAFDAASYKRHFLEYRTNGENFTSLINSMFTNSNHLEFVEKSISITVGQVTSNYHILFLAYGLFFGFFFSRNLAYVYKESRGVHRRGSMWVIIIIAFLIPPYTISGFDYWTASQVFIYITMPIIYENKKKNSWLLAIVPFIHFSFYLVIFLLISFYFLRKKKRLLLIFYGVSFLSFFLNKSIFNVFMNYLPSVITRRMDIYMNAEQIERTGGNIMRLVGLIFNIATSILFYVTYTKNKTFIETKGGVNRLFLFTLYFAAFFNVLSIIPSVGRYRIVANIFIWMCVFLLYNHKDFNNHRKLYNGIRVMRIFILFYCLANTIRFYFPMLGLGSILSNPLFVNLFVDDDYVVGNILKKLN
ncbi:hypothetical protein ACXGQW_04010 [Wenyingzhuangia sp. IMCC45533]